MKLITMTEYVLESPKHNELSITKWTHDRLETIIKYANFLKQPLELGMFIPCDKEGNVLENPNIEKIWNQEMGGIIYQKTYKDAVNEYKEALDRVLFEGGIVIAKDGEAKFLLDKEGTAIMFRSLETCKWEPLMFITIEDLSRYLDLTLTKSAINSIK